MSSPVQVKHEPGGDAFCVDTDSESEDIDIDKLQPLAPKFASLSKFPVGCKVWYDLRCSPETNHLHAKSAHVEEVFIHFENGRRVYKVKSNVSDEHEMCLYEDQLVYGISCPVRVAKVGTDEMLDGVVVYLQREKGSDGRRQVIYAVQYSAENCMTIESRVAADRIKYRAEDCGVGDDGSNISIDKQKETTRTQEEDEFMSDDEDGAKKQAGKEGKGGGTATRGTSPSKESAPVGLKASLKMSGVDKICLRKEGDAKEFNEPSSAQTDSAFPAADVPPAQKDKAKSEEGKRGANNSSAVIGDEDILIIQKDTEKKSSRTKKLKKQHNAAQASKHSMTAASKQPQTQVVPANSNSMQKQKQTAGTQEGDTDKEQREAEDSSHSTSVESFAQRDGNDRSNCNQSKSLDTTRWDPPSPSQRKRSSGSESNVTVTHRPTKVAKREFRREEREDVRRDALKGKAENNPAVRILTIPPWWRNQWGLENRRQLYSHLNGKAKVIKSSANCLIRISGDNPTERMRITIESLSRDPRSQLNSLRNAYYVIEKALVECLADENSKTRLLYDLAFSNSFQLTHRDSTSGLLLLQKEIKVGSHVPKSKEWWHLYELPCRWEMHPHDLSSIRLKLPKESDCKIEVFGRSVKVSRESPYVLVSGTKQRDVKSAAMMVANAVQRHQSRFLSCPPKPKR